MAESKAAVTRIAPNGIFSQVKTSAFFKSSQQTPILTSNATPSSRLPNNPNNKNTSSTPQLQQRPPIQVKPSLKPQAPQRPPPPPRPTKPMASGASRGLPPPIPPRPARLAQPHMTSNLPPSLPPPSTNVIPKINNNATMVIEADLTMLRGATSSSNIMNSTKIDDVYNSTNPSLAPPPPPLSLSHSDPRLSITQMVNEHAIIVTNKEIETLANKLGNASIILSNEENLNIPNKVSAPLPQSSPPSASIEMKTNTPTPNSVTMATRQQTPKSSSITNFQSTRRSGHDLKEFLKQGCNGASGDVKQDEEIATTSNNNNAMGSIEIEADKGVIVVKDIKYYRNLVSTY